MIENAMRKQTKKVLSNLPAVKSLVPESDLVRVTIYLSKSSVDFFKGEAKLNHTQYQKMIRNLLDVYAASNQAPPAPRVAVADERPKFTFADFLKLVFGQKTAERILKFKHKLRRRPAYNHRV